MSTNVKKVRILGVVHDIEDVQARTDIGSIKNNISSLQNNMSTAQGNISSLKGDISQLSEEIANLSGGTYSAIEPKDDDIPKVFINGNIPTTKDDVLAELEYVSKTRQFKAYLEIKCQGDSSMAYPKKNFTIKMFSDEARTIKLKKEFKGWGEHNKFVLKANWIDHSHARNIVSAKLWGQIVASRSDYESLHNGLKTSPNNGAIDGFPIKVYNNGTYQGIYTWNIPKDDWLYGIDEYDANQFVLYGQHNTNGVYAETATNFRKLWDGVSQSDREWEVEVGTNSDIVKTALNNVISLCMNADDVTFKNTLNNYLDIQSALDYYIFCYTICALDSLAQNMILVSYDGTKLYCSAYDLDSTFGLWWNGQSFVSTSYRCPEDYQEPYSLLWERIEKLYAEELKARYLELRNSVLSFHNMCTHFERFMDVIGLDLYAEDLTIYTGIPSGSTNNIKQIRNYIRDRLAYCDEEFGAMTEPISATGITLDKTSLSFTEATNQVLVATVEPSDSTDKVVWSSSNDGIAKVVNGVVTPITNGSCTITATAGSVSATCEVEVNMKTTPYLQNDGVAYIDLGINSRDGYSYEICLKDEKLLPSGGGGESGERIYFGNRFNNLKTSGQNYLAWTLKGTYCGYSSLSDTEKHIYKVDANNLYLDGAVDETANWGASTNHPSMVLFGANYINGASGFYLSTLTRVIKFYYLKIWDSNNELIHSYVPALKDEVACVLDEVTNEYLYNSAESGGFTYGED